jgi:hypothetical protein
MIPGRKMAQIIQLISLTVAVSALPTVGSPRQDQRAPVQAKKKHPTAPDLAVWEVQSLGRTGGDPQGEIGSELVRIKVKNFTSDRTITGILWEISIYDVDKGKVVEVLTPYTARDMVHGDITLKVAPGYLIEVPFYIDRKVHISGNHTAEIKVKNYAYRKYDPASDRNPANISYLVAEEWPFKSATEPVLIDSRKH